MSITMPARQDADGNWPEGAWLTVEPVYEGSYSAYSRYNSALKRDEVVYREFDRAKGYDVDTKPAYGPYRRNLVIGYKPTESASTVMAVTHVGLVISLSENNGYHDSDFYAHVWNPEKPGYERIMYASTRGYTYHHGASIDATPEVLAAAKAFDAEQNRLRSEERVRAVEAKRLEVAKALEVDTAAITRLEQAYGALDPRPIATSSRYGRHEAGLSLAYGFTRESTVLDRVLALAISAKAGRLRNTFKKNLAAQVLAWMHDPAPQHKTPLSAKQVQYI